MEISRRGLSEATIFVLLDPPCHGENLPEIHPGGVLSCELFGIRYVQHNTMMSILPPCTGIINLPG